MNSFARALVLGGAGFVGGWLVEALLHEGVSTTVLDNLSTGLSERHTGAELIIADLEHTDLRTLIVDNDIDVIFHLATAAYVPPSIDDPVRDLGRNTGTTVILLDAVRRVERAPLV